MAGTRGFGRAPAPIFNQRAGFNYPNLFKEGGFLSVSIQTRDFVKLVDELTRTFRGSVFNGAITDANQKAADAIANGMRKRLQDQIGQRPQRPGERLQEALVDDRNKYVAANVVQVGLESWLNSSPAALYWRSIEQGLGGYTARVLFSKGPGLGKPWFGPNMAMFEAHGRMAQFNSLNDLGKQRGALVHVDPIEPFHYMAGGDAAFRKLDMFDLYERHLNHAGIKITKDNRSSYFKL